MRASFFSFILSCVVSSGVLFAAAGQPASLPTLPEANLHKAGPDASKASDPLKVAADPVKAPPSMPKLSEAPALLPTPPISDNKVPVFNQKQPGLPVLGKDGKIPGSKIAPSDHVLETKGVKKVGGKKGKRHYGKGHRHGINVAEANKWSDCLNEGACSDMKNAHKKHHHHKKASFEHPTEKVENTIGHKDSKHDLFAPHESSKDPVAIKELPSKSLEKEEDAKA